MSPGDQAGQARRRWTVAQIGHREEYAAARAFAADGRLSRLYTDMWCGVGGSMLAHGPAPARRLALRCHAGLRGADIVAWTPRALTRTVLRSPAQRRRPGIDYEEYLRFGTWFDGQVARRVRRQSLSRDHDAFFSFNTGCLETLRLLRRRGIPAVVDQVHPARTEADLVRAEAERWPGWAPAPAAPPESYFERLAAEWDAAAGVVVNSDWSAKALVEQGVAADRIAVVPLAYEPRAGTVVPPREPHQRPLTVLWLGAVTIRKGIQYLVEAARLLTDRPMRFVVVGPLQISERAVASAPPGVEFRGSLTHDRIHEAYAAADVFVLPTISDGFALTQLEAMAHGLPVVTTPHCGQVVDPGRDGLVVPAGDASALAAALAELDDDRGLLAEMARQSPAKAGRFSLERYRDGLDDAIARFAADVGRARTPAG